jgi:predicted dehydrogenase
MSIMTSSPVSWALAGFGVGGRVFHAPLIRSAEGMELTAVVAGPKHKGELALMGAALVSDIDELPARGVEGVTITTPAGTHVELAHRALDLGLHVVVDKPFALNASDAQALVDHAEEAGLKLSVYQNRRWDGDYLSVKEIVQSGVLGEVHRFHSRIHRFKPNLPAWASSGPTEGGGVLVDLGPHLIDQAVGLFGRVTAVGAELLAIGGGVGAENDVVLSLLHESGTRSLIETSLVAASAGIRFQLNGFEGGVTLDGFDIQEEDLFAGRTPASMGDSWGLEPHDRLARIQVGEAVELRSLVNGAWSVYYPAMAAAIRGTAQVPVDPRDAVHTCVVIDAARIASAERRVVLLTEIA